MPSAKEGGLQLTVDELSKGPSPGYFSDEHAHKRGPGDPPSPVEDRPVVHPVHWTVALSIRKFSAWTKPEHNTPTHYNMIQVTK